MDLDRLFRQLDVALQTQVVKDTIRQVWNRVVAIDCTDSHSQGSGILFRVGRQIYVQTCYHVVEESDDITVKFLFNNYHEQYTPLPNSFLIGKCKSQDKAIYCIRWQPSFFREMPDLAALVADVRLPGRGSSLLILKGLVEYYNGDKGYTIHFYRKEFNGQPPNSCTVTFYDGSVQNGRYIEACSESGCYRVRFRDDEIPQGTKDLLMQQYKWRPIQDPTVVMISHPDGQPKRITHGKYLGIKKGNTIQPNTDDGTYVIIHNAETSNGSSGGCALLIGKESYDSIGYNSYLCMHRGQCDGDRVASWGLID